MLTTKQMAISLITFAAMLGLFLFSIAAQAQDLGFFAESMFDRLDANHDGVLSKDEVRAARAETFDRIDTNHDGVVTVAEIEAAKASRQERAAKRLSRLAELRAQMQTPSERLAAMDKDGDGKISRAEFVNQSPWFDRMPKNGAGVVTKADFAAFLDKAQNAKQP
jgi:Ca2+-binding EF-hand superfamily protein